MSVKPTLLLVDDEERILRSLAMLFRQQYELRVTTDPMQALQIASQQHVDVVISDQKMPQMRGAELLRRIRAVSPNTMRLLLTGYSELDAILASVNEGEIFRFINKPWNAQELRDTVAQATRLAQALQQAAPAARAADSELQITTGVRTLRETEDILVIDDDAEVVRAIREIVGPAQTVHWATSQEQALELLSSQRVGVVVSELLLGREHIATMLKVLKADYPEVVTVVMTPFQDTTVLIGLINQGQVYRFLPKPVRRGPLGMNLASALRQHRALKNSSALRATQAVEALQQPEELGVASRVRGLLSRLRGRPETN